MLKETHRIDSVFVHDSIYVRETADTVVRERWRTCWRDRIVHDTVREHTTDTVRIATTEQTVVEVPSKGSSAGWIVAASLFLLIVAYILIRIWLKR